jgi:hypothetical protein
MNVETHKNHYWDSDEAVPLRRFRKTENVYYSSPGLGIRYSPLVSREVELCLVAAEAASTQAILSRCIRTHGVS